MTSSSWALRAVIFDFDGVIVDTEPHHFSALAEALAPEGLRLSEEEYARTYMVLDDRNSIRTAFAETNRLLDEAKLKRLMERKAALFWERIRAGAPLFPGVSGCIRALASEFPLAIASGALRHEIEAILASHRLEDAFAGIVSSQDVLNGKPHPETYLKACELLNRVKEWPPPIQPTECVVIEDTVNGVRGAKAAGMRVLAVTNSYPAERLFHADVVLSSLEGLTPATLGELLRDAE